MVAVLSQKKGELELGEAGLVDLVLSQLPKVHHHQVWVVAWVSPEEDMLEVVMKRWKIIPTCLAAFPIWWRAV